MLLLVPLISNKNIQLILDLKQLTLFNLLQIKNKTRSEKEFRVVLDGIHKNKIIHKIPNNTLMISLISLEPKLGQGKRKKLLF
jgi:uncharacterized Fe-S cluster-containing protein